MPSGQPTGFAAREVNHFPFWPCRVQQLDAFQKSDANDRRAQSCSATTGHQAKNAQGQNTKRGRFRNRSAGNLHVEKAAVIAVLIVIHAKLQLRSATWHRYRRRQSDGEWSADDIAAGVRECSNQLRQINRILRRRHVEAGKHTESVPRPIVGGEIRIALSIDRRKSGTRYLGAAKVRDRQLLGWRHGNAAGTRNDRWRRLIIEASAAAICLSQ